jgi:hypothetical protein
MNHLSADGWRDEASLGRILCRATDERYRIFSEKVNHMFVCVSVTIASGNTSDLAGDDIGDFTPFDKERI